MLRRTCTLTAIALLAGCVTTPRGEDGGAVITGPEASIAFADQRATIREWQADGVHGIWVQDAQRNWYYGKFHVSCFGLDFANAVGFQTGSTGRLDRFSSVVVPGEGRCNLQSFVQSAEPPDDGKRRKGDPPQEPDR